MPKSLKTKQKESWPSSVTKYVKEYKFRSFLIVLFVLFVGTWVYGRVQIYNDKQRFALADETVQGVIDEIQTKIGKADKVVNDSSCGRPNLKFAEGPLSCSSSIQLLYENVDYKKANEYMGVVSQMSNERLRNNSTGDRSSSGFIPKEESRFEQVFNQNLYKFKDLSCSFGYQYPVLENPYFDLLQPSEAQNTRIKFSCSGSAKAEHYPIR